MVGWCEVGVGWCEVSVGWCEVDVVEIDVGEVRIEVDVVVVEVGVVEDEVVVVIVPSVSQITNICSNIEKNLNLARIYTDVSYRGEAYSLI